MRTRKAKAASWVQFVLRHQHAQGLTDNFSDASCLVKVVDLAALAQRQRRVRDEQVGNPGGLRVDLL